MGIRGQKWNNIGKLYFFTILVITKASRMSSLRKFVVQHVQGEVGRPNYIPETFVITCIVLGFLDHLEKCRICSEKRNKKKKRKRIELISQN